MPVGSSIAMVIRCAELQPIYFTNTCDCGAVKTIGRAVCATCALKAEVRLLDRAFRGHGGHDTP